MGLRGRKPWEPGDGDEPVATLGQGEWILWHRPDRCSNGWHTFALQPPPDLRKKKSIHYGGWNGERLARGTDMTVLAEHDGDIYDELERQCALVDWDHDQ